MVKNAVQEKVTLRQKRCGWHVSVTVKLRSVYDKVEEVNKATW